MSQWILKDTMKITASHTVRPLTEDEYRNPGITRQREQLMVDCRRVHGEKINVSNNEIKVENNNND